MVRSTDEGRNFFLLNFRQQQQVERVKKWLQLRNRDSDHRTQVEERRRKREEEAKVWKKREREKNEIFHSRLFKAKIDDLLRREKEREQRVNQNRAQKADSAMTMSTDVLSARRAVSASRLRSNHPGKILSPSYKIDDFDLV